MNLALTNLEGRVYVREFSRITVITIKRPAAHNAMTSRMWQELKTIGDQISMNPKTKVVLLRGAFSYFTAGSDIKEFSQMSLERVDETFSQMEEAISTIQHLKVPTIALIKGSAMGAGLQLALACDLRVAADNAQLGMPVARLGITIGTAFAKRLVDLIGPSRAKDMLFTGRPVNVQEGMAIGLVNYSTPTKEVEHFALRLAKTIANQSAASVQTSKEAVTLCLPQEQAPKQYRSIPFWVDTMDFREGVNAFIEKRAPRFKVMQQQPTKAEKNCV